MPENKNDAPTPIVTLTMNEEHKMGIDINKDIGMIMNDDADHDNTASQRIYASEALTFALATNAKELVLEGLHPGEVMTRIIESLADNLAWALDVDIKVHPMSGFPPTGNPPSEDNSPMLS